MKLKTIIADDEPLARKRLRLLLESDQEIEIIGECRNGRELIGVLKSKPVDLVFLDIEMPGNDGFEVIEQIGVSHMPLTVFVTAHDSYAVQAFEVHALDYLMKPIEPERLQRTLVHIKERIAAAHTIHDQLSVFLERLNNDIAEREEYPERLLVSNGTKDSIVKVKEIEWIEAADYYALLHVGSKTFALRKTIKQLASTLDPKRFIRVHRSAIVNVDYVSEILRDGRGENWVVLSAGRKIRMSKAGWRALLSTGL